MGDVIQMIKVVKVVPKFDKEGNLTFEERRTMQRQQSFENFEIDYDGEENRRLVARV
jgi:hypothetical protein